MSTYYCDLTADYADNPGTLADPYAGPAGLQAALRGTGNAVALVAGDTLYIKGSGDLSRLVLIDCDSTDVTGWGLGDVVRNKDAGSAWQGVVVETNSGGFLGADDLALVWLDSGYDEDSILVAEGVTNDDASGGASDPTNVDPLANRSAPGVYLGANGTNVAKVHYVGVNAAWVEDGSRAVLDGADKAYTGLRNAASINWQEFRNIHTRRVVDKAWMADQHINYSVFVNCVASESAGGFGGTYAIRFSTAFGCTAYDNNAVGMKLYYSSGVNCTAYNNGAYGFELAVASLANSVSFENVYGAYLPGSCSVVNCVFDKNLSHGVVSTGASSQLVACRITNNASYGIFGDNPVHDPYSFYSGNAANFENDIHDARVRGVSTRVTTGTIGYIDNDDATPNDQRNYGLTNQAAARRMEAVL